MKQQNLITLRRKFPKMDEQIILWIEEAINEFIKQKQEKTEDDDGEIFFNGNTFYTNADEYSRLGTSEEELLRFESTSLFIKEITKMIMNGELININLNAQVRKGKSTLGIVLAYIVLYILNRLGKSNEIFDMMNIARDQQEEAVRMRNPELFNSVIMTDEWNETEDTGENVTSEKALANTYSDVQAARYIHKIKCSPKDKPDKNADIIIEVIEAHKGYGVTHCRLYFDIIKQGFEHRQLLGYINIPVFSIIETWVNEIEPIFLKPNKTPEEKERILKARQTDFYVEYMCKKYEKMDVCNKEGIYRTRELTYAKLKLDAEQELMTAVQLNYITKDMIKNTVKRLARKHKIILSELGKRNLADEISGIMGSWKAFFTMHKKRAILKSNQDNPKKAIEKKKYDHLYKTYSEEIEKIEKDIRATQEELQKQHQIYVKYNEILGLNYESENSRDD